MGSDSAIGSAGLLQATPFGAGGWSAETLALFRSAISPGAPGEDGEAALDALLPLVYRRLREVARGYLSRERPAHTLTPTALVHEAYLRLQEQPGVTWRSRTHLVALAALMMRRVLVNHAVARGRKKRGQGFQRITIDTGLERLGLPGAQRELDVLEIEDLLQGLAALDARQARVVELRFFGGMDVAEVSEVMGISPATVKREWATARLWLLRELRAG